MMTVKEEEEEMVVLENSLQENVEEKGEANRFLIRLFIRNTEL